MYSFRIVSCVFRQNLVFAFQILWRALVMLILPPCCLGTCSCQCVLRFFLSTLSKVLRLPRKSDARSYEVLHLSRKIISANLKICLMLQNAPPLRKSAPGPPNSSDEHVSCTAPATENASLQILFKCPTPAIVFGNATKPAHFVHFWQGAQSLVPATRNGILRLSLFWSSFFFLFSDSSHLCFSFVHIVGSSTSKLLSVIIIIITIIVIIITIIVIVIIVFPITYIYIYYSNLVAIVILIKIKNIIIVIILL